MKSDALSNAGPVRWEWVQWVRDVRHHVRSAICGLSGHQFMMHAGPGRRLFLRCAVCGQETHGWNLK